MSSAKVLHIKILQLQIRHDNPIIQSYFSITYNDKLYFSSVFDDQLTYSLYDDIIIILENNLVPEVLSLQRWQNHMVLFDHELDISELKTRSVTKKKFQTRKSQVLTFLITIQDTNQIAFSSKLIKSVSQHYLILENIKIKTQKGQMRGDIGACYFLVDTSSNRFAVPVSNGNIVIQLPETVQISHFKNGQFFSKSKLFTFDELDQKVTQIQLYNTGNSYVSTITFQSRWAINLSSPSPIQHILLHSYQLLFNQIQLRFQIPNQFVGSRFKIMYQNKSFQFSQELGNSKLIKLKKCVWFVCKSQTQQIQLIIQRSNKILTKISFLVQQICDSQLSKIKHKLSDFNSGKHVGSIKYQLQKSKNIIHPQQSKFWKQCIKKKQNGTFIQIQQVSLYFPEDQILQIVVKSQNQQKKIKKISNLHFFEEDPQIYHTPVILNVKSQESLYLMVKKQDKNEESSQDFIGIAVLNINDVKLGISPIQLDFYKNQEKMGTLNCLINKYVPSIFIKSSFQPQSYPITKTLQLSVSLTKLSLTPYFYSYKYDFQQEVFCIMELNKIKKVLIMENTFDQLNFSPALSSDHLHYNLQVQDIIKGKITIMVSDGINQQMYGSVNLAIKLQQLRQKSFISLKSLKIQNFIGTIVGECSIDFIKGNQLVKKIQKIKSKQKLPFNNRNKSSSLKKTQQKTFNSSIQNNNQSSLQLKKLNIIKNLLPSRRYSGHSRLDSSIQLERKQTFQSKQSVKLPMIKQKKKIKQNYKDNNSNIDDILTSMKVRKRTMDGYNLNNQNLLMMQLYKQKHTLNNQIHLKQQKQKQIDLISLRYNNPNIDRNFQMLHPLKKSKQKKLTKEQLLKNQISGYQQRLKGLKSVMHQIQGDIQSIQPSIKDGNNTDSLSGYNYNQERDRMQIDNSFEQLNKKNKVDNLNSKHNQNQNGFQEEEQQQGQNNSFNRYQVEQNQFI